jgi:hypothetical protein
VVAVVSPFDQAKVQPDTPPEGTTTASPSDKPKQLISSFVYEDVTYVTLETTPGSSTVTLLDTEQSLESNTVTEYLPALKPVVVVERVTPLLHR